MRACLLGVLSVGAATLLPGQVLLRTWRGVPGDSFGVSMASLDDVNADGYVDFAVGAPDREGVGVVDIFTTRQGALVRTVRGQLAGDHFGLRVTNAGDLDRDGRADLWVVSDRTLTAISGADGRELQRYPRPADFAPFGDYDGDGHADVALASSAEVVIRSGRDGCVLGRIDGASMPILNIGAAGDVNADGRRDVMVRRNVAGAYKVEVWDIARNGVLFERERPMNTFGEKIGGVGDVDGDGIDDFFIFDSQRNDPPQISNNGIITVYAGGKFAEILSDLGQVDCNRYGYCIRIANLAGYSAMPADVDGNGRSERFAAYSVWGKGQTRIRRGSDTILRLPYGAAIAAGDANRDGVGDYLMARAGEVWLVSGADAERQHLGYGTWPQGGLFHGPYGLGDVDGDTVNDFAYSYAYTDMFGVYARASVVSGRTGVALRGFGVDQTMNLVRINVAALGNDYAQFAVAVSDGFGATGHQVRVFGAGATPIFVFNNPDGTYGRSVAGGADWDGDRIGDVFIAAATFIEIRSTLTGKVFAKLPFGAERLTMLGDVDGDGIGDLCADRKIVGSRTRTVVNTMAGGPLAFVADQNGDGRADCWQANDNELVLLSAFDNSVIRRLPLPGGAPVMALAAGGDWNADGVGDLVIGQPTWYGMGRAAVVSGFNGMVLHTEWGNADDDLFGSAVALLTGDPARGFAPALAAGATRGDWGDRGYGRWSKVRTHVAGVNIHGLACGVFGDTPRFRWTGGSPLVGQTYGFGIERGPANAAAVMMLGMSEDVFGTLPLPGSLTGFGMLGCTLYVAADLTGAAMTTSAGDLTLPLPIPNHRSLLGLHAFVQFAVTDLRANLLGLVTSDAARIVLGQ